MSVRYRVIGHLRIQRVQNPSSELMNVVAILLWNTKNAADHSYWQTKGEVSNEIEIALLGHVLTQPIDRLDDEET